MNNKIKSIAIHLPQFHPIPENDEWWGKGFTEWTNVSKARPSFKGHYQPHLPTDLGFYDLRLEESRIAQAELARASGIDGFCYYHYWFNGKRLLHRPIDDILATGKPDFPFMLCWANENWSRRWDGMDKEVLIKQEYNLEDDRAHIRFLCKNVFSDPRYIRVDGKPFFLIYRPGLFPDIRQTVKIWREEAKALGTGDLYLGYMESYDRKPAAEMDLDCAVEFHPDFSYIPSLRKLSFTDRLLNKLKMYKSPYYSNYILSYDEYADKVMNEKKIRTGVYPGITPMWDNTARRKNNAVMFVGSTPEKYGQWFKHIIDEYKPLDVRHKFIFINAWNEWAEGNHLEPCIKWGRKYLDVTRQVIQENER